MEKNIHDNEFNDYVQRSFDSYEELPADDMWERVAAQLEPGDKKLRPAIWWWVSGLAAAGLIVFGWMNIPSGKAPELQAEKGTVAPPAVHTEKQSGSKAVEDVEPAVKAPIAENSNPSLQHAAQPKGAAQNLPVSTTTNGISHASGQPSSAHQEQLTIPEKATHPLALPYPIQPPVDTAAQDKSATTTENKMAQDQALQPETETSPTAPAARQKTAYLSPFHLLQQTQPALQHVENQYFTANKIALSPHSSSAGTNRFYLGVSFAPLRFTDKTHFTPPLPGRTRVASFTQKAQPTADWSLKAGGSITRRWGWETGISYRSISRRAMHFPRFRFQQGVWVSTTQQRNYDFTYNLDTYGGSAEVTVRMEQQDNNPQVSPNESVSLKVLTQENVQLLRVPLLLTAQFGKGKLKTVIKGGLTGSYILSSKIDFRSRISTSTRFRVGPAYTVYPELNNRFFLGYQVSAGLNYRIFPQWSLVAEPVFASDFSRKTKASTKLPELRSFGLNMGINHYF